MKFLMRDRVHLERILVVAGAFVVFILSTMWIKDQGEPGSPIKGRLISAAIASGLLISSLLVATIPLNRILSGLLILGLLLSGFAASVAMLAYGWISGILTLLFYVYVAFSVGAGRWKR